MAPMDEVQTIVEDFKKSGPIVKYLLVTQTLTWAGMSLPTAALTYVIGFYFFKVENIKLFRREEKKRKELTTMEKMYGLLWKPEDSDSS